MCRKIILTGVVKTLISGFSWIPFWFFSFHYQQWQRLFYDKIFLWHLHFQIRCNRFRNAYFLFSLSKQKHVIKASILLTTIGYVFFVSSIAPSVRQGIAVPAQHLIQRLNVQMVRTAREDKKIVHRALQDMPAHQRQTTFKCSAPQGITHLGILRYGQQ